MLKIFSKKIHSQIAVCFLFFVIATAFFIFAAPVLAGSADNMLFGGESANFQAQSGLGNLDIRIVIARVIRYILGFMGIVAVGLIIYGGWLYMTSEGDQGQIDTAKKYIINAAIGMVIVLSSFGIASFILNRLMDASGGIGGGAGSGAGAIAGLGASGNNIIESHYPMRNQEDVPRNTMIVVSFKEPMDVADIITAGNINTTNVLIYRTVTSGAGPFVTSVAATVMPDNKTFRFDPAENLGSPSEDVWYTVYFSGAIKKENGDPAFSGAGGGYSWSFEVSTFIDTSPPQITSVIPVPATTEARNVVVQLNFSEALDPTSASGPSATLTNINVYNNTGAANVDGNYYISNQYRTVEFLTEDACGVNSCGDTIYCLPGNADLTVLARAATLVMVGDPAAVYPYDGIVDMAGNSLDGNSDNNANGPQSQSTHIPYDPETAIPTDGDDYSWSFNTNNTVIITSPEIDSFAPAVGATNIGYNVKPEAIFNRYLMSSTLTKNSPAGSGSIALYANPIDAEVFYWISKANATGRTAVYIEHEAFAVDADYTPEFNSGIKDIYQNCYAPSAGPGCTPNPPTQPYCCEGILSTTSCD
ncbi:MAG: Ig-like domain-containing protein [Candidatus Magasanikbacteria bacterium]|nr:Ig-like domain-containing protein [Candidatus Magasanikbacteria bacterium]